MPKISLELGDLRALTTEERARFIKEQFKYAVITACKCRYNDKEILIPVGFLCDGSTVGPDMGWAWLIHDYLYASHKFADGRACCRQQADSIMYHMLDYERYGAYKYCFWLATRLCRTAFNNAWKESGERGVCLLNKANAKRYES